MTGNLEIPNGTSSSQSGAEGELSMANHPGSLKEGIRR
jgi:hypothetical protein